MPSQTLTATPASSKQSPAIAPLPTPSAANTPPPGTWEHPRLAEISRRRVRDEFDERKLRVVVVSAVVLALSIWLPTIRFSRLATLEEPLATLYTLLLYSTRTLAVYKGYTAIRPIWRRKDDMSDIALTPSQRALLGLGPASAPATPGSTYITPPRYLRSASRSSSRAATVGSEGWDTRSLGGSAASNGSSWGAASPSSASLFGRSGAGGGVFDSPLAGSPLARKAMGQRASLGAAGLGASIGDLASPSPVGGAAQQQQRNAGGLGLSNKFLYQRRVASNSSMPSFI